MLKDLLTFTKKSFVKLLFYLVILSTNFLAKGPTNKAVPIAMGKLTVQAFKNLLMYSLSIPVLTKVIIKVIRRLIKKPIIKTNKN